MFLHKKTRNGVSKIEDLNSVGTVTAIFKNTPNADGNITAVFREEKDLELSEIVQIDPFYKANVTELIESKPSTTDKSFKISGRLCKRYVPRDN